MARIKNKDLYLNEGDKIYLGTDKEASLGYINEDLFLNHTISGVDPIHPGHLVTKRYVDDINSNVGYVEDGDIYFYDSTRDKDLGAGIIQIGCGRNSKNTTNQYLRMYDSVAMNLSGITLPFDSTLVGMTMAEQDNTQSWTAQVRKNDSDIIIDSLSIVNSYENHTWNKNTDLYAGDRIQVYITGTNIKYPQVMLYFRRRKL